MRTRRNAFKVREEYLFVSRWTFDFVALQKKAMSDFFESSQVAHESIRANRYSLH